MAEIRVNLSDCVLNAAIGREVPTLHRDYFRLRKPLERRRYELARKHCGKQDEWAVSLDLLRKKCGSGSSDKEFRRLVNAICAEDAVHGHPPDYGVTIERNNVRFINRSAAKPLASPPERRCFQSSMQKPTTTLARSLPATTCTIWKNNGGVSGLKAGSPS